jgi:hypothetical protein
MVGEFAFSFGEWAIQELNGKSQRGTNKELSKTENK